MRAWRALPALLFTVLPGLICLAPSAGAEDDARAAARTVIARQAEAFGRDDAATAYAQAAPAIREIFPSADLFLGMVRDRYRPVYRHRSFVFGEARETGAAGVTQSVAIQDEDGVDWTAEYSLEQGADGQWRITGCRLVRAPGTNT